MLHVLVLAVLAAMYGAIGLRQLELGLLSSGRVEAGEVVLSEKSAVAIIARATENSLPSTRRQLQSLYGLHPLKLGPDSVSANAIPLLLGLSPDVWRPCILSVTRQLTRAALGGEIVAVPLPEPLAPSRLELARFKFCKDFWGCAAKLG
jgi:hypothetical protein